MHFISKNINFSFEKTCVLQNSSRNSIFHRIWQRINLIIIDRTLKEDLPRNIIEID